MTAPLPSSPPARTGGGDPTPLMTPEEAVWMYRHVWPQAMRLIRSPYPRRFFTMCACRRAVCAECDGTAGQGRASHGRCPARQPAPAAEPITYLTDTDCRVIGPPLYPATTACRCPCLVPDPAPAAPSAPPAGGAPDALFPLEETP